MAEIGRGRLMARRASRRCGTNLRMTDTFDFGRFDALTFDCYGTLIDWEAGLLAALRPSSRRAASTSDDDALLERVREPTRPRPRPGRTGRYREVLAVAARGVGAALGVEPTPAELEALRRIGGGLAGFP